MVKKMPSKNEPITVQLMTATGIPINEAPVIDVLMTKTVMLRRMLDFVVSDLRKNKPVNKAALKTTVAVIAETLDEQIYIMLDILRTEDTKPLPDIFDANYDDFRKAVRAKNTAKKLVKKKRK